MRINSSRYWQSDNAGGWLVKKVEPICRIMSDKQKEQNPYAYYRELIDCPECGKSTHELYHDINEGEQPTLMCGNCYEEE